jgi:hypothetical protein
MLDLRFVARKLLCDRSTKLYLLFQLFQMLQKSLVHTFCYIYLESSLTHVHEI